MTEVELERLIVRLQGDAASYQKMLDDAQSSTSSAMGTIERMGSAATANFQRNLSGVAGAVQQLVGAIPAIGPAASAAVGIAGAAFSSLRSAVEGVVSGVWNLATTFASLPSRVGGAIAGVGRMISGLGGSLRNFGMQMTMTMAPLAGLGAAAIAEMRPFGSAINQMVGLVGLSREAAQGFAEEIKKMTWTGKGPTELAQAMFFITSAGMRGSKAMETLRVSAMAASAGLGETKSVADAVTSAVNAYGEANLTSTRATEVLTAAVRAGKAEASGFAPVFGRLLPSANEMGIKFQEVGGILAFLTKSTGDASTAATGLRNIMSQIMRLDPERLGGKALAKVGVSAEGIRQSIKEKGLLNTLIELRGKVEGAGISFVKVFHDIEALNAVLQLTGPNMKDAKQVVDDVANSVGIVDEAFKSVTEGIGFKLNVKMAETKVLLLELGDLLAPAFGQILDWSRSLINVWKQLDPQLKQVVGTVVATAAAIGPAMGFISGFVTLIGTGLTTVGTAIATILSPLGAVAALAAAAGVAVAQLQGYDLTAMWTRAKDAVAGFQSFAEGFVANFQTNINILGDWLKTEWAKVWGDMEGPLTRLWASFQMVAADAFDFVLPYAKLFADKVMGFFANLQYNLPLVWPFVKKLAVEAFDAIESKAREVMLFLVPTAVQTAVDWLTRMVKGLWGVVEWLGKANVAAVALSATIIRLSFTNPYLMIITGAGLAIAALEKVLSKTLELKDVNTDTKFGEAQRMQADQAIGWLRQLEGEQKLSNAQVERAQALVRSLNKTYGDLGIRVDNVAGKVTVTPDVEVRLSKQFKQKALEEVNRQSKEVYAAMESLTSQGKGELVKGQRGILTHFLGLGIDPKFLESYDTALNALQDKQRTLWERRKQIQEKGFAGEELGGFRFEAPNLGASMKKMLDDLKAELPKLDLGIEKGMEKTAGEGAKLGDGTKKAADTVAKGMETIAGASKKAKKHVEETKQAIQDFNAVAFGSKDMYKLIEESLAGAPALAWRGAAGKPALENGLIPFDREDFRRNVIGGLHRLGEGVTSQAHQMAMTPPQDVPGGMMKPFENPFAGMNPPAPPPIPQLNPDPYLFQFDPFTGRHLGLGAPEDLRAREFRQAGFSNPEAAVAFSQGLGGSKPVEDKIDKTNSLLEKIANKPTIKTSPVGLK